MQTTNQANQAEIEAEAGQEDGGHHLISSLVSQFSALKSPSLLVQTFSRQREN